MESLIFVVLFLQIVIYLINTIGAKAINELSWVLFTKLPLAQSKFPREQLALRNELLKLKKEMHTISSQDEFAKWARVRRQHDKKQAEYDAKASQVQSSRSQFETIANIARWLLTSGLRFFLQFWHSKTPVVTYPRGWMPWQAEWILGFPRAPYGSVSVQVWGAVCAVVVGLVGDAIGSLLVTVSSRQQTTGNAKTKMPVNASDGTQPKKDL